jgi:hypothetical protein
MRILSILLIWPALTLTADPRSIGDEPTVAQSRAIVQSFGAQLTAELTAALGAGGPAQAIGVCKDRAPQIASELSRQSGAAVERTSRRFRNPANAPEPWQVAVLQQFEAEIAAGSSPAEYLDSSGDSVRYMKAIPIQPVCLVCHGEVLSDEVLTLLDEHYPHDRARGYLEGELRGAFSVSWPAPD